jgi:hypothetical protein
MTHPIKTRIFLAGISVLFLLAENGIAGDTSNSKSGSKDEQLTRSMGQPFYSGAILPTPKQVTYRNQSIDLYDGETGEMTCELEIAYEKPARELVDRLLTKRIDRYKKQFDVEWKKTENRRPIPIVFMLANDPEAKSWIDRYYLQDKAIELRPQGYILEIRPEGVVCIGKDDQGIINGTASFLQLLHVQDGKLAVREASVFDWPSFTTRYTSDYKMAPNTDFLDWLLSYKINGFACGYADYIDWRGLTDTQRDELKMIGDYIRKYRVLNYMVLIHTGGLREDVPAVDPADPEQVKKLLATTEEIMKLSEAERVMILHDDVSPPLSQEAARQFQTLGRATGDVLDKLYKRIQTVRPGTKLLFCPPPYMGRNGHWWQEGSQYNGSAIQYMVDVRKWNPNIGIVWTGPTCESLVIVQEDIEHYKNLIGRNRTLAYWDNTWHTHQPLRNFHGSYPKNFADYCDGMGYIHIYALRPIGRYFSVTAGDYYWNADQFDDQRAWRHAAAQLMGPPAVPVVERFYKFRGETHCYYYAEYLAKNLDPKEFGEIVSELENVSWSPKIPENFRKVYTEALEYKKKQEAK